MLRALSTLSGRVYFAVILLLVVAPVIIAWLEQSFYLDLLTRILILTIAVTSLNLIVSYGGMISLGHAAYIGIGAYCVGIPSYYEVYNGFLHLGLAMACSASFALITGMICLRTRGLYFILITLAFTQMLYYTFVSIDEYGADDGLLIYQRSEFGGLIDIENATTLYYLVLVVLLLSLYLMYRLTQARFGRVLFGCKHNDERMQALGYDTYKYKLVCYVISGTVCGVAGFFLGNFTNFISPEMMDWVHSGDLIFMMVIGGTGAVLGPLTGTVTFLLLEEFLSGITVYWHLIFGLMLIALVMFGKGGLHGLLTRMEARK
ncbi:MAG: branched-chain amino acid ABC transporter permease [Gammaproteobacteria bacterium]|nr:branched-chain amino acid ABC transporter permease [Gammaproteobacteria bacterium]